jgi:hypothetical protein
MIGEVVAVLCLGYGSYKDIGTREIPDAPWLIMGVTGVALRLVDHQWKALLVSAGVAVILGSILAFSQLFGGADIKAFVALSLLIPVYSGNVFPVFIVSVFNNLALIKVMEVVAVFLYNMVRGHRFQGNIPLWKKISLYMTGFPRSVEKMDYRFLPLQDTQGKVHILPDIDIDIEKFKEECDLKEIWVTYGSPLIVYLTIGLVIALLGGDILLSMVLHVV